MKRFAIALLLIICLVATGCGGKLNAMYQDIGIQYIQNIGTMTFEEAKKIAEASGYYSRSEDKKITIKDGNNCDITLYFNGMSDDSAILSSFSYNDENAWKSFWVSSSFISTFDYEKGNGIDRKVDSLSSCEKFLFGTTSGIEITAESLAKKTSAQSDDSTLSIPEIQNSYDSLQELFVSISKDTTSKELEDDIASKSLHFTSQEYNKSGGGRSTQYVIAFTDGAAAQKYADSGDRLTVDFDNDNGTIMYAQYTKESSSESALFYNYGYWYDFSQKSPGDYSGYYYIDPMGKKNGITIKYSNGREKKTNYFQRGSAESALNSVI